MQIHVFGMFDSYNIPHTHKALNKTTSTVSENEAKICHKRKLFHGGKVDLRKKI